MSKAFTFSPQGGQGPEVQDLASKAKQCGYRVKGMAGQLGRSCRWLELFCHKRFALTPHAWLARLRAEDIRELARTGIPAKAICRLVGFADAASFCHSLKRSAGCTLRELRVLSQNRCSHKDNKGSSPQLAGPARVHSFGARAGQTEQQRYEVQRKENDRSNHRQNQVAPPLGAGWPSAPRPRFSGLRRQGFSRSRAGD